MQSNQGKLNSDDILNRVSELEFALDNINQSLRSLKVISSCSCFI